MANIMKTFNETQKALIIYKNNIQYEKRKTVENELISVNPL